MAEKLGISASYVNLLEKNERPISVPVLFSLLEIYGVDWKEIADGDRSALLSDIRAALQDPLFEKIRPDLPQLRASLAHCPDLVSSFLRLQSAYKSLTERLLSLSDGDREIDMIAASPEASVHKFFHRNGNYFDPLEKAALGMISEDPPSPDEIYGWLKRKLRDSLGITVKLVAAGLLPNTFRRYEAKAKTVLLSEALDYPNRVFQLFHVACLVQHEAILDTLVAQSGIKDNRGRARCRVELANYFAAAALMPYDRYFEEAKLSKYDFDHLATRFGVSFEQACHRAVTLRRPGSIGVPFFFLRVDQAGNITKRFNATDFHLAEHGGACARLEVHGCFRTPGRIVPQLVEMPGGARFLVFSRTVDRASFTRHAQDHRLAIAMGCAIEHADAIGYAEAMHLPAARPTEVGINCRVCPRRHCDHRAQHALVLAAPVDAHLRGATHYEN